MREKGKEKIISGMEEEERHPLHRYMTFEPTDSELINYYLQKKVMDPSFSTEAIKEVDFYMYTPRSLYEYYQQKCRARMSYFFVHRDRLNRLSNREAKGGYWKPFELLEGGIGYIESLMFCGSSSSSTSWIMQEYRLRDEHISEERVWVICRLFKEESESSDEDIEDEE